MIGHLKTGFQQFSLQTSIHGFAELYQAKCLFWKIFWLLVVGGSFGVTVYQVHGAVVSYMESPTNTIMLPVKENEILYPPLLICYAQWMFWVDWNKAINTLNISKEILFFGLNYFNMIYYSNEFDLKDVREKFNRFMTENNFTSVSQFYAAIARDVPIIGDNNINSYFDRIEIMYKDPGFLFCYKISGRQMVNFFSDNQLAFENGINGKQISFKTFDETYSKVKNYVTVNEYNQYMLRWIKLKSMYHLKTNELTENLTDFAPPILIYPNAYNKKRNVDIYTENDLYTINLKASARTVKNNERNVCLEGYVSFASNDTCFRRCMAMYHYRTCSCLSLDLSYILNYDKTDQLCQKGFSFIKQKEIKTTYFGNNSYPNQNCSEDPKALELLIKCKQSCLAPCTVWTYDITASATRMSTIIRRLGSKNTTNVTIEYPIGSSIIIMTEVDAQTWENFIGSVGGLLGIWTGASIVSFIQFIYLCCFKDSEEWNFKTWLTKPSQRKQKPEPITVSSAVV